MYCPGGSFDLHVCDRWDTNILYSGWGHHRYGRHSYISWHVHGWIPLSGYPYFKSHTLSPIWPGFINPDQHIWIEKWHLRRNYVTRYEKLTINFAIFYEIHVLGMDQHRTLCRVQQSMIQALKRFLGRVMGHPCLTLQYFVKQCFVHT